jgi:chromosome segregation ATPase
MRTGFRETHKRLDQTHHRIDQSNERIDRLTSRVEALTERVGAAEVRIENGNERIDRLTSRVETLTERVGSAEVRIENGAHRIIDTELPLATAVMDLHSTVQDVQTMLRRPGGLHERVERCEREIDEIKKKLS